ncbi:MAG TPA: hypothetical protein DCE81_00085 [Cytophagales bacterium]|nr:hypothetical protein [Cytophagales bacterium]
MTRLLFDHSPLWLLPAIAAGLGYAWLLYHKRSGWSATTNRILFALRATGATLLFLLLVGLVLRLTDVTYEKPVIAIVVDHSASVRETTDSVKRQAMLNQLQAMQAQLDEKGYEVVLRSHTGMPVGQFDHPTSDLAGAIRSTLADLEGKKMSSLVLVSDGIYNSGTSPLYQQAPVPVHAVGVGDTTERKDLVLKQVIYNKITYQGNEFPLRAEVAVKSLPDQPVTVRVRQGNRVLSEQTQRSQAGLLTFDFRLKATDKGLQRYEVEVLPLRDEVTTDNNRANVFIDVVEGRKKILLIASAPHPDIKALAAVIEKNANYEWHIHIPGLSKPDPAVLKPGFADLLIVHGIADATGKWPLAAINQLAPGATLFTVTSRSNIRQLAALPIPLGFEPTGQRDEATPVINTAFRGFDFSENLNAVFSRFPPAAVPFGRFSYPPTAEVLLHQRIGSVATDRPLLLVSAQGEQKAGILLAENFWRWRLGEFADRESTAGFDELFSKLIQYLSTREDKRKFRSFAVQPEFSGATPVQIESQVFNDLFEPIYGQTIDLVVQNENQQRNSYQYVTSPGNTRFRLGNLPPGIYRFTASTLLNGQRETAGGQFLVSEQQAESLNLTADFSLLRELSRQTGGRFVAADQLARLQEELTQQPAQSTIRAEDSFKPLINLKWIFFLVVLLIGSEWFIRKYSGGY